MKQKGFRINIPLIVATILVLIFFIMGSSLDMEIAEKIANQSSAFGILLTATGNMPAVFFGVFGGAALLFVETRTRIGKIIIRVAGVLDIIIASGFLYVSSAEFASLSATVEHETLYKLILVGFIVIADAIIIILTFKFRKRVDQRNLLRVAILIIAIIGLYSVCGEIIKYLASRPRPRQIWNEGMIFREWYQWKPLDNLECKSFVSGHAANATCLMTIIPLFMSLTKFNNKKYTYIISFVVGGLFACMVAISRMVAGAHFLTDVTGGMLLSIFFQALVMRVGPLILNKIDKEIDKYFEKKSN